MNKNKKEEVQGKNRPRKDNTVTVESESSLESIVRRYKEIQKNSQKKKEKDQSKKKSGTSNTRMKRTGTSKRQGKDNSTATWKKEGQKKQRKEHAS